MKRLFFGLVFVTLCAPAFAADSRISTFACGEYSDGHAIDVQVADDTAPMLRIRDGVVAALKKRNSEVSEDASWALDIDATTIRRSAKHKGPTLGSVDDGLPEDDVNIRMNLWSTRDDSLIGGRKDEIVSARRDEVRVSITINDKTNGKCLWRGEAVYDTTGRDQWEIAVKVAEILIGTVGQAISNRPLEID
jgi:hypothetical protein